MNLLSIIRICTELVCFSPFISFIYNSAKLYTQTGKRRWAEFFHVSYSNFLGSSISSYYMIGEDDISRMFWVCSALINVILCTLARMMVARPNSYSQTGNLKHVILVGTAAQKHILTVYLLIHNGILYPWYTR